MQQARFVLPDRPAGTDQLSMELYSEQHIDANVKTHLNKFLLSVVPPGKQIKALILGAKCGLTAQFFLPACSHLDLVELQPFKTLLEQRFLKSQEVDYFFGKQGFIGTRFILPKPTINATQVRVLSAEQFCNQAHTFYDVVLLQNCIITDKINLVQELIKIQHETLLTMIIPGRILTKSYFPFIAKLQKFVLMEYYINLFHEQVQNRKFITGRREEIIYYEVFGWKKKSNDKETQSKIHSILDQAASQLENIQKPEAATQNPYQAQEMVDLYLNFHFGANNFGVQNYPSVCSLMCIQKAKKFSIKGRALDLGCAVGRTSIDLADYFDEVIGLDFSAAFIKAAQQALTENYEQVNNKVKFVVGNACNLDPSLGKFNLIFGGNLIDRLPNPLAFLNSIGQLLEENGILILTSPYSWLQEFTSKQKWIGGYLQNGHPISTNEGLKRILQTNGLKEISPPQNIRFCIKQNDWIYQYTLACATFWQKQSGK